MKRMSTFYWCWLAWMLTSIPAVSLVFAPDWSRTFFDWFLYLFGVYAGHRATAWYHETPRPKS